MFSGISTDELSNGSDVIPIRLVYKLGAGHDDSLCRVINIYDLSAYMIFQIHETPKLFKIRDIFAKAL